ncbi:unnamed protein product [Penicillium glandicola]
MPGGGLVFWYEQNFLFSFIVPILKYMLEDRLHLDPAETQFKTSTVLSTHALVCFISGPFVGSWADSIPSRKGPLLCSLTGEIIGTVIVATAPWFSLLLIGRAIQAIAGTAVWIVGMATVADTVGAEHTSRTLSTLAIFFVSGLVVGPLVSGSLLKWTGYWPTWFIAIFILVVDMIMRLLMIENRMPKDVEESIPEYRFSGDSDALLLQSSDTPNSQEPTLQQDGDMPPGLLQKTSESSTKNFYKVILRNPRALTAMAYHGVDSLILVSFDTTLPLYVARAFDWNTAGISSMFLLLQLPALFLLPLTGRLKDRIGTKAPSSVGLLVTAVLLCVQGTSGPDGLSFVGSGERGQAVFVAAMLGLGIIRPFVGGCGVIEMTRIIKDIQQIQPNIFGPNGGFSRAYGLTNMSGTFGMFIGPIIAGSLIQTVGYYHMNLCLAPSKAFLNQIDSLQVTLQDRLPGYMVPELYIPVSHIPLTLTGKANRKFLRDQVAQFSQSQLSAYMGGFETNSLKTMPITAEEESLQQLWSEILGVPLCEIGRDDYWTRLGGDSILAMNLVNHARKQGLILTVPDIVRCKTISALAPTVHRQQYERSGQVEPFQLLGPGATEKELQQISKLCGVDQSSVEDAYPCIGIQYITIGFALNSGVNTTLRLEFQMPSDLNRADLISAWEKVVTANPILRTQVVEIAPGEYLQVVMRESIPLDLDGLNSPNYAPGLSILQFGKPLIRVTLQGNSFVMLIEHVLYDGYSWPLIVGEIDKAYRGQALMHHSYAPFVQWACDVKPSVRQFWMKELAGFHGNVFPPLREDGPSPLGVRQLHCQLPLIHDDYTAANKLRLALAIVISWYQGTTDVVFGTVSARRGAPVPDIVELPAPAIEQFPVRIQLEPKSSLRVNMDRVQEQALTMMSFEAIGRREIQRLSPEAAAACAFQTLLMVYPEKRFAEDSIFRQWDMKTYGPLATRNMTVFGFLSTTCVDISVHLSSEATIDHDALATAVQWEHFLDQFQAVFQLIQTSPELPLAKARFLIPAQSI